MIFYVTRFPLKETFSEDLFLSLACRWVKGGKNYQFQQLNPKQGILEDRDLNSLVQLRRDPEAKRTCVHLEHHDGKGHIWVSDFCYKQEKHGPYLVCALACNPEFPGVNMPQQFKLPYFLKLIQDEGYAGMDGMLPVRNVPYGISGKDQKLLEGIFTGNGRIEMPVVYLPQKSDGTYGMDAAYLGVLLSGAAHVLKESDEAATVMRENCFPRTKREAMIGCLIYPDGQKEWLSEKNKWTEREVSEKVYAWLRSNIAQDS